MKLINEKLDNNIWFDVDDKALEHAPWDSPIRNQIGKNFGVRWDGDNLFRLKIGNSQWHIGNDLDETD